MLITAKQLLATGLLEGRHVRYVGRGGHVRHPIFFSLAVLGGHHDSQNSNLSHEIWHGSCVQCGGGTGDMKVELKIDVQTKTYFKLQIVMRKHTSNCKLKWGNILPKQDWCYQFLQEIHYLQNPLYCESCSLALGNCIKSKLMHKCSTNGIEKMIRRLLLNV